MLITYLSSLQTNLYRVMFVGMDDAFDGLRDLIVEDDVFIFVVIVPVPNS